MKAAVDADGRGAHMLSQHWILEDYSHCKGPSLRLLEEPIHSGYTYKKGVKRGD